MHPLVKAKQNVQVFHLMPKTNCKIAHRAKIAKKKAFARLVRQLFVHSMNDDTAELTS